ncbi:DUF2487 family protein [Paenibacillus nanensis]|uniref:DUF2487 family protein n=1 Tax=Paenibacillus nanensis TaxID=393251 RepID=A0A3A1UY88_9BACL|nr:DUF2487 family protein [Paenibacillus nanensis]RIX53507.1 DUF2487 family protein [Paenibacillus nanensis]
MKFSDITSEKWDELKPYLDTCLLPVTGMSGKESPYEATERLERLRDLLDLVEIPFKGRVVTYPACHYVTADEPFSKQLANWCDNLRAAGFQYIILASADQTVQLQGAGADLVLQADDEGEFPEQAEVSERIRALWRTNSP